MKDHLRCIIVDDEEGAHLVLDHYIQRVKSLMLSAQFYNALDAMDFIYKNEVDVVFLDITMPGLSGMEMLKAMANPPMVVLTTAYAEFALESYNYQVIDYLVKPIEFPRFISAIDKVIARHRLLTSATQSSAQPAERQDSIMLKIDGNYVKVMFEDILFIQSWGNYVKVHTTEATHLSLTTTTEIEQKLDKERFMRIHKSYIVALHQIQKIIGNEAHLKNGTTVPIGNTFRRELLELFQQ